MKNYYSISFRKHFLTVLFTGLITCSFAQVDFELSKYVSIEFPVKPTAISDAEKGIYSFTHQSEHGLMCAVVAPANINNSKSMMDMYEGALEGVKNKSLSFESKKTTWNHCTIYTVNYEINNQTNGVLDGEMIILYFRDALFFISYNANDQDNPLTQTEKENFLSSLTLNNQNGAISQLDEDTSENLGSDSAYDRGYAMGKMVGMILMVVIGAGLLYTFRRKLF